MEPSAAPTALDRYPTPDRFLGILPYMVSGPACWHLLFGETELLMHMVPYPREFGTLESQVEAVRRSWPPEVKQAGHLRSVPYADVRSVKVFGGWGLRLFPKLVIRTVWRPGTYEGQNFAYAWYFKRGPFTPDSGKAQYAKELLPRILPVRVGLAQF